MNSSEPDLGRFLMANTHHVTSNDIKLLYADAGRTKIDPLNTTSNGGCIIVWEHPDGYILHVDEPDTDDGDYTELFAFALEHGYSEHLVHLMQLSQRHQCQKLVLSHEGPDYDDLPRLLNGKT